MSCMSKRQTDILSERLKDRLTKIKNDAELALVAVEEIGGLKIACCKCHGKGKYEAYEWDEEIKCVKYPKTAECEVCHGTGKIPLEFYEDLQRGCRR